MLKFYQTPVWKIFLGPKCANLRYFLLVLFANLVSALLEGSSFALMFLAFSSMEGHTLETFQFYNIFKKLHIAEWLHGFSNNGLFFLFILSAVGLQAFRSMASYLACYGASLLASRAQLDAQSQVYRQIFRFSFQFISKYQTGDLAEYAKTPSLAIPAFLDAANRFVVCFLMIVGALVMMFFISPNLTAVTISLFGVFALMQKTLIAKVIRHSGELTADLVDFSHQVIQSLQGIRPIHAFHRHSYILNNISQVLNRIVTISKKVFLWNGFIQTINETINILIVGAILIFGSLMLTKFPTATLPSLLTYLALAYRLATRLQNAMGYLGAIAVQAGPLKRLNAILHEEGKEFINAEGQLFEGFSKEIEFRNVFLTYPNSSTPVLHDLSFSIPYGSVTAFVGYSGAGKSSILDLLLRLFEPTKGNVFIDSENLRTYSLETWRKYLGVVSQDTYIFNATIEENIRFGCVEATQEQIIEAAKASGSHSFISAFPHGYQTLVGERGYRLSGGERQRIAIARALLKNPHILILDEATSSLDSHTEHLIHEFVDQLNKNTTLILVAYRLATIIKADQIFVLENGRIIESGQHDSLIEKNGRYAYLWRLQSEEQAMV